MKEKMFQQLAEKPKTTKKWFFLPLSIVFHGILIAVVVVLPLIGEAQQMPPLKVVTVTLAAPSPPSLPVGRKGGGGRKKARKNADKKKANTQRPSSTKLITPIDIPDTIKDEDLEYLIPGAGYGPGIEGAPEGDPNGIPGGLNLPNEFLEDRTQTKPLMVKPPRLIKQVKPIYPQMALRANVQGVVLIQAVTNIYGRVVDTKVINGNPLLRDAAVKAVKQWIYEPYVINGNPRPVTFTAKVTFTLHR